MLFSNQCILRFKFTLKKHDIAPYKKAAGHEAEGVQFMINTEALQEDLQTFTVSFKKT